VVIREAIRGQQKQSEAIKAASSMSTHLGPNLGSDAVSGLAVGFVHREMCPAQCVWGDKAAAAGLALALPCLRLEPAHEDAAVAIVEWRGVLPDAAARPRRQKRSLLGAQK
jgi:hypothetical protein